MPIYISADMCIIYLLSLYSAIAEICNVTCPFSAGHTNQRGLLFLTSGNIVFSVSTDFARGKRRPAG